MGIPTLAESRLDPFDGTFDSLTISDEAHVIPINAPFVIYPNEAPLQESPSTVVIPEFTEVAAQPSRREFQVDYTYGTGEIRFHPSDAGTSITVSYKGKGSPALTSHFNKLAIRNPADSFVNDWHRLDEVGDHFAMGDDSSTVQSRKWGSSGSTIYLDSHAVRVYSTGTQNYIRSHRRFNPGYGFVMAMRAKVTGNPDSAGAIRKAVVGVGSINTTNGVAAGLLWEMFETDEFTLHWKTTAGGNASLTNSLAISSYQELTVIYTPGLLTVKRNRTSVVTVSTNISTTVVLPLVVQSYKDVSASNVELYCDFVAGAATMGNLES